MRTSKEKVNINSYPAKEDHSGAMWERGWNRQRVKKGRLLKEPLYYGMCDSDGGESKLTAH